MPDVTSTLALDALRERVEALANVPSGGTLPADAEQVVGTVLDALERGTVRAGERDAHGTWRAVSWVKQAILMGFRLGRVVDMSPGGGSPFHFYDKHTYPTRALSTTSGVRIVPGGSTIRRGAYVAAGVVCMPPMYINVGAYVGEGSMVDSHALIGSCAQIGARVHVSAGAQIGGVVEPVNASPVVIEG